MPGGRAAGATTSYGLKTYRRDDLSEPLHQSLQAPLLDLLNEYGPHFEECFGTAMRQILFSPQSSGLTVIGSFFEIEKVVHGEGTDRGQSVAAAVVAHACIVVNPASRVGLFGFVITREGHQQQGLASQASQKVFEEFDAAFPSAVVTLGTGSPHAAKMYQRFGFVHLAGGLGGSVRGYNPADEGEWMMIRRTGDLAEGVGGGGRGISGAVSDGARAHYLAAAGNGENANGNVEFLNGWYRGGGGAPGSGDACISSSSSSSSSSLGFQHWPDLVLLLNAYPPSEKEKLKLAAICTGLEAEEQVLRLVLGKMAAAAAGQRIDSVRIFLRGAIVFAIGVTSTDKSAEVYVALGLQPPPADWFCSLDTNLAQ